MPYFSIMTNAHILTIGTEITTGEIVNTNAAWLSEQLESLGVRVHSHLTVRDQRDEMLAALRWAQGPAGVAAADLVIVTGGLGPTSDDMTRALVAEHLGLELEFDDSIWSEMNELYKKRGLPIREAHKHQCWFPEGSERLANPTGTALGFYARTSGTHYFVLPGPPRELEGMFQQEVVPRLKKIVPPSDLKWHRWNIFAVPESEVAELVEPIIAGSGLEVGYRAQVPYVRLKLFANSERHSGILAKVTQTLAANLVEHDLAEQLLHLWPDPKLKILDDVSDGLLAQRLFAARRKLGATVGEKTLPEVQIHAGGLSLTRVGEQFKIGVENSVLTTSETRSLPYKMPLDSERGRKSAVEWTLWLAVSALQRSRNSDV